MSANITFTAMAAGTAQQSIILIPKNTAIKNGRNTFVWTIREGFARRIPILTGRELESGLEVKSGLDGGETIIVTPPDNLHEGQTVSAKPA